MGDNKTLKNVLNKYDARFSDFIIHIFFVKYGIRNAMLVETANLKNKQSLHHDVYIIFKIILEMKLIVVLEHSDKEFGLNRYIVINPNRKKSMNAFERYVKGINGNANPDYNIGKLLGYYCYKHDFSNTTLDRTHISVIGMYKDLYFYISEICETDKLTIKNLKSHYRKLIRKIKAKFNFFDIQMNIRTI